MTAREMLCFLHFFPLIFGCSIPDDDSVWKFMLIFLDITTILLSYSIDHFQCEHLEILIQQHHELYVQLFKDHLKPKHHFMIHYPQVIRKVGPPRKYWCFLFEAMHKQSKMYCRAITSRVNIALSVATKYQMQYAHMLMTQKKSIFTVNGLSRIDTMHKQYILNFSLAENLIEFVCYRECIYRGKKFKSGFFFCQHVDTLSPANSIVFQLLEIITFSNANIPYLLCKRVTVMNYSSHYASLEISTTNENDDNNNDTNYIRDFAILNVTRLKGPPLNANSMTRGKLMLRPKCFY